MFIMVRYVTFNNFSNNRCIGIKMKIKVGDTNWEVILQYKTQFEEQHGQDCVALTDKTSKEMFFCKDNVTLDTIIHELFHAYMELTLTSSAGLSGPQVEEVAAELVSKYGFILLKQAKQLYNQLTRLA